MTSDAEKEAHTHTQTDARENKWEKICYKVSHMTHTHSHPRRQTLSSTYTGPYFLKKNINKYLYYINNLFILSKHMNRF